jgi:hypothetical protein
MPTVRQSCPQRRRGDASGNGAAKHSGMSPVRKAKRQQALSSANVVALQLRWTCVQLLFPPNALTCSDLAWRISPSASMALDVQHQRRLGVLIEKEQCLNAGSSSGQHARRCRACPKCIPHVEGANHAFETSNKCGALLEVILLTRSSSSPHFASAVSPLSLLSILLIYPIK